MGDDSVLDELREQVGELRSEVNDLNRHLLESQLDAWKGRIDQLEVQLHLAQLDAADDYGQLIDRLNERWATARRDVDEVTDQAGEAVRAMVTGARKAMEDLREGMADALRKLRA